MSSLRPVVLAIVGRPNVGKSTLFNCLTRSRSALVADFPGVTRDRQYGRFQQEGRRFIVIDTGGFTPNASTGMEVAIASQVQQALVEADVVLFVVDGRSELVSGDHQIAQTLRRFSERVLLVANKTDGLPPAGEQALFELCVLGYGAPVSIAAAHGRGIRTLLDQVERVASKGCFTHVSETVDDHRAEGQLSKTDDTRIRVAVVGRPNVGKSTLINALIGEERLLAFDEAGTTRDAIAVDFSWEDTLCTLIDTAGIRRKSRVATVIEKFSMIKALKAIEDSHVCIFLLDALSPVLDQDLTIARYILQAGRALVLAVNKCDLAKSEGVAAFKDSADEKIGFLNFAERCFISAKNARGLKSLMNAVRSAFRAAMGDLSTRSLNDALRELVKHHPPPLHGRVRPKMRFAHQGGKNPPIVVIHGTSLRHVSESYRRYITSGIQSRFKLTGTPMQLRLLEARQTL